MLYVIQVGENEASDSYIKGKKKDCEEVGIVCKTVFFRESMKEDALIKFIERLGDFGEYDGVIVQLPLPKHINKDRIIEAIPKEKDVDGFRKDSDFIPCTPAGIMKILEPFNIEGKDCLIINRSEIVGKPLILPLLDRDATVTVAHSKTKNLDEKIGRADLVVSAVGQANFITPGMVKPDAIIIDVGINFDENGKLVGDAAVPDQSTPVPGGVGLLTRLAVLENIILLTTGGNCYGSFS